MKPLTFYISFTISPELASYLGSLSPEEKIDMGCGAVDLAKIGLQAAPNMILYCPFSQELSELSPRNLATLGAGLINIAVDEMNWDYVEGLILSIKEVPA
jgi:hypothetical protein